MKTELLLQKKLSATRSKAENLRLQADTALKYAEQVWWSWDLKRKRMKIRAVGDCILGYTGEDLSRGEDFWWERIHPHDIHEVRESLEACFTGKETIWQCEHRMRDVEGCWVWVEHAGFVLKRDRDSRPTEMVGTTKKTEERYQLLALFRQCDALISTFAKQGPVAFWLRDRQGSVLLSSTKAEKLLGKHRGRNLEADLAAEDAKTWQSLFKRAASGENGSASIRLKTVSNGTRSCSLHCISVASGDDHPYAVLEVFL